MQYFWKEQDDIPAGMGYPLFGVIHILSVVITLLFVLCGLKAFLQLGFRNRKKVLKAIPVVMFLMEIFKDCFLIRVHRFGLGFLPLQWIASVSGIPGYLAGYSVLVIAVFCIVYFMDRIAVGLLSSRNDL